MIGESDSETDSTKIKIAAVRFLDDPHKNYFLPLSRVQEKVTNHFSLKMIQILMKT